MIAFLGRKLGILALAAAALLLLVAAAPESETHPAPERRPAPMSEQPFSIDKALPNLSVIGLSDAELKERQIKRVALGELNLPFGRVVATDPLVQPERPAFARAVPPGRYAVTLYPARGGIALAELRFSGGMPTRWELAVLPGQDAASLKAGEIFGYPVDAGLGCFMDASAPAAMTRREEREREKPGNDFDNYFDGVLMDDLGDSDYAMHVPLADEPLQVAVFKGGWGDGYYASYWGLDASGAPLVLLTEFAVLENGDARSPQEIASAAVVRAMTPEQKRDGAVAHTALTSDDLGTLTTLVEDKRVAPETLVEEIGGTLTYEAIRLDKPDVLDLLVRHGAPIAMPKYLHMTKATTYPDYARLLTKPRSPRLMDIIARWESGGVAPGGSKPQ